MPYPSQRTCRARPRSRGVLLATLDRNEMVARFLDMYAAEYRRPGRADQPALYREQFQTIRREAILAMVLRIEAALPARLKVSVTVRGARRPPKKEEKGKKAARSKQRRGPPDLDLAIPFLDLFREEFFVALGQALDWTDQDAEEFWHDLGLVRTARRIASRRARRRSRHRIGAVCRPRRAAARSFADGSGAPRRRQI